MTTANEDYYKVVQRHREQLAERPALQALYAHWAARISAHLSAAPGPSIELGCGAVAFGDHLPDIIKTDIYLHPWVDRVVDACAMPFAGGECANLLAVDMVHHLPEPSRFFSEVERVLAPGGRCILLEPYISPGSYPIYKLLHHEPVRLLKDPFEPVDVFDRESGGPCNEAIPTLAFTWRKKELEQRWPALRVKHIEYSDLLVYLLTGGYSKPSRIPAAWVTRLIPVEDRALKWLGALCALRMLVVLEKVSTNAQARSV